MRSDSSSLTYLLEALRELLHSLRTPLGVALTIAKDSKNGLPLSLRDYGDSVDALEKIKGYIDELRPILNLDKLDRVSISPEELATICEVEGFSSTTPPKLDLKYETDSSLLRIWLHSCYRLGGRVVSMTFAPEYACLTVSTDAQVKGFSKAYYKLLATAFSSLGGRFEIATSESRLTIPGYSEVHVSVGESPRQGIGVLRKESLILK